MKNFLITLFLILATSVASVPVVQAHPCPETAKVVQKHRPSQKKVVRRARPKPAPVAPAPAPCPEVITVKETTHERLVVAVPVPYPVVVHDTVFVERPKPVKPCRDNGFSIQGSATIRIDEDLRNPVQGTLAMEFYHIRAWGSLGSRSTKGTHALESAGLDFVVRSCDGPYVGAGLVVDRRDDKWSEPKNDGYVEGWGKTGEFKLDYQPSILLGVSARHGLFTESRVVFKQDGSLTNRTSIGLRF